MRILLINLHDPEFRICFFIHANTHFLADYTTQSRTLYIPRQPHSDSADEIYNSRIKIFLEPKSDQRSAQTSSGSVMYSTVSRLSWSWCASTEWSHAGTELGGPSLHRTRSWRQEITEVRTSGQGSKDGRKRSKENQVLGGVAQLHTY
jgi:hypothetical protein